MHFLESIVTYPPFIALYFRGTILEVQLGIHRALLSSVIKSEKKNKRGEFWHISFYATKECASSNEVRDFDRSDECCQTKRSKKLDSDTNYVHIFN